MKRLVALFLALCLGCSLGVSAMAVCGTVGTDLEWEAWKSEYRAAHPEEVAAFDPDAHFAQQFPFYDSKQAYLNAWDLSEEEFRREMEDSWLGQVRYETDRRAFVDGYEAAHPGELAAFDADAYFGENYFYYSSKEEYLSTWEQSEEEFEQEMLNEYIDQLWARQIERDYLDGLTAKYPEETAAFDADAWFAKGFEKRDEYFNKEEYMYDHALETEEAFSQAMLKDYLESLEEKAARRNRVEAYEAAHPGAVASFDPVEYLKANYSAYREPKEAFMEDQDLVDEEDLFYYLFCAMLDGQEAREQRQARLDVFEATHPGVIAAFDADAYYQKQNYYYSKAEYMSALGIKTEEDFRYWMLDRYMEEITGAERRKERIAAAKAALGGTAGELGIMLGGTYLDFPEGRAPYAQNGTTYADADTLSKALGVELEAGVSGYIQVRTAARAAGVDVYWDQDYETVVLLDPAQTAAEMDKAFTILNGVLEQWAPDREKHYRSTLQASVDMTVYNSIDGDAQGKLTASGTLLQSPAGVEASFQMDEKTFWEAVAAVWGNPAERTEKLTLETLAKGGVELRWDRENETCYLRMPGLAEVYTLQTGEAAGWEADTWIALPYGGDLFEAPTITSVGEFLYAEAELGSCYYGGEFVYAYEELMGRAQELARILGDGAFVKKGASQTLTLTAEDLVEWAGASSSYYDVPKEFAFTMTVAPDGTLSGSAVYRPYSSGYSYDPDMRISADWSISTQKQSLNLVLNVKNTVKLTITLDGTRDETRAKPAVTPLEGAEVLTPEELMT